MFRHLFKCVFLVFCSFCLLACTTHQLLHSSATPATQSTSWVEQIRVGDTLEIQLAQTEDPLTFKVTQINSTSIYGEKGEKVQINEVVSVENIRSSWTKTTLLILGVVLIAAAASVKSDMDEMDDMELCMTGCQENTPSPQN